MSCFSCGLYSLFWNCHGNHDDPATYRVTGHVAWWCWNWGSLAGSRPKGRMAAGSSSSDSQHLPSFHSLLSGSEKSADIPLKHRSFRPWKTSFRWQASAVQFLFTLKTDVWRVRAHIFSVFSLFLYFWNHSLTCQRALGAIRKQRAGGHATLPTEMPKEPVGVSLK